MTYEEVKEIIESKICYSLLECMDGNCKHNDENPCAVQMAIEVLDRQIPKKPAPAKHAIDPHGESGILWDEGCCPNCKRYIRQPHKYCWKCGQKIDWSGRYDMRRSV